MPDTLISSRSSVTQHVCLKVWIWHCIIEWKWTKRMKNCFCHDVENIPPSTRDYVHSVRDWLGMKKSSIKLFFRSSDFHWKQRKRKMDQMNAVKCNLIVDAALPSRQNLLLMTSQLNFYWLHVESVAGWSWGFLLEKPAIQLTTLLRVLVLYSRVRVLVPVCHTTWNYKYLVQYAYQVQSHYA